MVPVDSVDIVRGVGTTSSGTDEGGGVGVRITGELKGARGEEDAEESVEEVGVAILVSYESVLELQRWVYVQVLCSEQKMV